MTRRIGRPIDVEQGTIEIMIEATVEATIEAATKKPPMGDVGTDAKMITMTMIMMAITAMDIAVKAATVAAEEAFTSVV
jgi:hypothetical protein